MLITCGEKATPAELFIHSPCNINYKHFRNRKKPTNLRYIKDNTNIKIKFDIKDKLKML